MKARVAKKPADTPAGRQTMLKQSKKTVQPSNGVERASPEKWKKIRQRAGELAMNQGKRPREASEENLRHAKRELLGLQTLPDPEAPDSVRR